MKLKGVTWLSPEALLLVRSSALNGEIVVHNLETDVATVIARIPAIQGSIQLRVHPTKREVLGVPFGHSDPPLLLSWSENGKGNILKCGVIPFSSAEWFIEGQLDYILGVKRGDVSGVAELSLLSRSRSFEVVWRKHPTFGNGGFLWGDLAGMKRTMLPARYVLTWSTRGDGSGNIGRDGLGIVLVGTEDALQLESIPLPSRKSFFYRGLTCSEESFFLINMNTDGDAFLERLGFNGSEVSRIPVGKVNTSWPIDLCVAPERQDLLLIVQGAPAEVNFRVVNLR